MEMPDGETKRRNRYHLRKTNDDRPDTPTIPNVTPVRYTGDSSSPTKITREVSHTETPNTSDTTSELPAAHIEEYMKYGHSAPDDHQPIRIQQYPAERIGLRRYKNYIQEHLLAFCFLLLLLYSQTAISIK